MKLSIVPLFPVILLLYTFLTYSDQRSDEYFNNFYSELSDNSILDNRYHDFIGDIFTKSAKLLNIRTSIIANEEYSPQSICIYVVKLNTLSELSDLSNSTYQLLSSVKENMMAVSPNVILIDSKFLGFLLLCAENSNRAYAEGNGPMLKMLERYPKVSKAEVHDAIKKTFNCHISDVYLRYNNIGAYHNDNIWYDELDETAAPSITERNYDSEDDNEDDDLYNYNIISTFPFLVMITCHELVHLQQNKSYYGWNSLQDLLKNIKDKISYTFRKDEIQADSLAIIALKRYIKELDAQSFENMFNMGIIAFTLTMRDLLLFDVFNGFRGLSAADNIVTIDEYEANKPYPLWAVENAYYSPVPLMTPNEYKSFVNKIRLSSSSLTHQHILIRMFNLFNTIKPELKEAQIVSNETLFRGYEKLIFATTNLENKFASLADGSDNNEYENTNGIGISKNNLINGFEKYINLQDAINVNGNKAWVGRYKDLTIELWGPEQNLRRARIIKHHMINSDLKDQDSISLEIINKFLFNFAPELHDETNLAQFKGLLENVISEKQPLFHLKRKNGRIITVGRVNGSTSLRILLQ